MNNRTNHHQVECRMCGAPQGQSHDPTCDAPPLFGDVGVGDHIIVDIRAVVRIDDVERERGDVAHFLGTVVSFPRSYDDYLPLILPVEFAAKLTKER